MSVVSVPGLKKLENAIDFTGIQAWLDAHRQEYVGQWVVLDGERLVGAGDDPSRLIEQARSEGVTTPFVEFIRDTSIPFLGGWV